MLLAVGTAMGEVTSNYFTFRPRGRLIHVDAEPRVLEANHPGLGIHADAALALRAIAERLPLRDAPGSGARVAADLRTAVQQRLADQDLAPELASDARPAGRDPAVDPHVLGHDDRRVLGMVGVGSARRRVPLGAGRGRARVRLPGGSGGGDRLR